jgi:hypothetical protein
MDRLSAIPTFYAGVQFRSRAEARWAVLFDCLKTKWLYESEGFRLETIWYLPDFWLPDIHCFAEVKGVTEQWDELALRKVCELARAAQGAVLLLDDLSRQIPYVKAVNGTEERWVVHFTRSILEGRPWFEFDLTWADLERGIINVDPALEIDPEGKPGGYMREAWKLACETAQNTRFPGRGL